MRDQYPVVVEINRKSGGQGVYIDKLKGDRSSWIIFA
jgi:hypothetical protein